MFTILLDLIAALSNEFIWRQGVHELIDSVIKFRCLSRLFNFNVGQVPVQFFIVVADRHLGMKRVPFRLNDLHCRTGVDSIEQL